MEGRGKGCACAYMCMHVFILHPQSEIMSEPSTEVDVGGQAGRQTGRHAGRHSTRGFFLPSFLPSFSSPYVSSAPHLVGTGDKRELNGNE